MKNYTRLSFLCLILLGLLPDLACASAFTFSWQNPAGDKSVYYLTQIFGNMSTVLQGGTGNALVGSLFNIFNIAVLTLGSLVVSYTIVLSTINTAQEGEVMGKKWSSMWIPFRSAVGVAFLIPTASGYSIIQIMLMNIIVLGIAAGNQIWQQVINSMQTGTGVFGQVQIDQTQINLVTLSLLNGMVCAQVMNSDPTCQASLNNETVSTYTNGNIMYIGVQGDPNNTNVCGGVQAGAMPASAFDSSTWIGANLSAFYYTASSLASAANEIYNSADPINWTNTNVIQTGASTLSGGISAAPMAPPTTNDSYSQDAINNGWIFAGSYYFEIISQNNNSNPVFNPPTYIQGNTNNVSSTCAQHLGAYTARVTKYLQATNTQQIANPSNTLQLQQPSISQSNASAFYQAMSGEIDTVVYKLMNSLTTNQQSPIASLQQVGAEIMSTAETIWFLIITISFFMMLAACIMSGMQPACWCLGVILTVLTPILTIIISLLWGVGAMIGIYLPMVPYLVFTFTALGWLILVIESIAAAPVIALGLVSPSQEELGKASPAVLLIANVFLRPSLMIIGFIIASKLVNTAVTMVNYGFQATVQSAVGALGIFGCIALLCLYGGLVISIIHECFSLIHVLPDKIMRWISGQAEQSSVKEKLQEAKAATEKGAQVGGELMKGSASFMHEQAKKAEAKQKKVPGDLAM